MSQARLQPPQNRTGNLLSFRRWAGVLLIMGVLSSGLALLNPGEGGAGELLEQPIGDWTSLLPPLFAIVLAIVFRSLIMALSAAFILGAILTYGLNPTNWIPGAANHFIWHNLSNQFQLAIFGFLFCLIGMVHVAYASGGIPAMVRALARLAQGHRSAQGATFLSGLAVFFDDYSNTVVVGNSMRSLTDRALPTLWMAIFILVMGWSMKTICETLGTDTFLISLGMKVWLFFPAFLGTTLAVLYLFGRNPTRQS